MFDFPASPTNGQTVTGAAGQMYVFNGTSWTAQNVAGPFVKIAGDTMSGLLTIAPSSGTDNLTLISNTTNIRLQKSSGANANNIWGMLGTTARWVIVPGDNSAESGSNSGSNLIIARYTDAGAMIDICLVINRATADVSLSGHLLPVNNNTKNLGSTSSRWATVYTADLSLNNGVGDWTLVEGEDDLFLYNNKKGKTYKFTLTEVDPSTVPPKRD